MVRGDVLDSASLDSALSGVDVAYYLVHSMGATGSFEEADRKGARNFAEAARTAGVKRIIYLGGLGRSDEHLSPHLKSRQEVGRILGESGVPVLEFRASVVIGKGSLSFEMIRSLVERLPVMVTPRWVNVPAQPIAIDDLIAYLIAAVDLPESELRIHEIGGADQVSYADIMRMYARHRGLRRLMLPVPVLTPYISSLWLGLVTPLYARVGRKLIESIVHSTVIRDESALRAFTVRPVGIDEAMRRAVAEDDGARSRWSDSVSSARNPTSWDGVKFGRQILDARSVTVPVDTEHAFRPIQRIGGNNGWYAYNWLWEIRGFMDLLTGGVGVRRGRRSATNLRVGDTLDFWRVELFEPNRMLRLRAEMKLPGRAWLEFRVEPQGQSSRILQTAIFDPVGLAGKAYWYALYPLHHLVFRGMLRGIAHAATVSSKSTVGSTDK